MISEFLKKCVIFTVVILVHLKVFTIFQQVIYHLIGLEMSSILLSLFFTLSISIVVKNMFDGIPKK